MVRRFIWKCALCNQNISTLFGSFDFECSVDVSHIIPELRRWVWNDCDWWFPLLSYWIIIIWNSFYDHLSNEYNSIAPNWIPISITYLKLKHTLYTYNNAYHIVFESIWNFHLHWYAQAHIALCQLSGCISLRFSTMQFNCILLQFSNRLLNSRHPDLCTIFLVNSALVIYMNRTLKYNVHTKFVNFSFTH